MKKALFVIWSLVWIGVMIWVAVSIVGGKQYVGKNLNFSVNNTQLIITDEDVTIAAASKNFFFFRTETGLSLVSVPTEKPLGWEYAEYYTIPPTNLSKGKWLVEKGDVVSVSLTSEKNTTAQVITKENYQVFASILIAIAGCVLWLLSSVVLFG